MGRGHLLKYSISIYLPPQYHPVCCDTKLTIPTTATDFLRSSSFAECVLWEISSACVDTKQKGVKVTCIVSDTNKTVLMV